jgi:hypothetical protein
MEVGRCSSVAMVTSHVGNSPRYEILRKPGYAYL